jgi:hypothetical protein
MNEDKSFSRFRLPVEGRLPAFVGATDCLNTEPLTPAALHGNVVAVQFWTYTCINWLRTLPHPGLGRHIREAGTCRGRRAHA